jgi:hypothetical protein
MYHKFGTDWELIVPHSHQRKCPKNSADSRDNAPRSKDHLPTEGETYPGPAEGQEEGGSGWWRCARRISGRTRKSLSPLRPAGLGRYARQAGGSTIPNHQNCGPEKHTDPSPFFT